MHFKKNIDIGLSGEVQVGIVEKGQVVKMFPPQKNLILNQGMDKLASSIVFCQFFTSAAVGTGVTPTKDDGGLTTATLAGTTVTLAGGTYTFGNTASDAGRVIKWGTGEERTIATITDPTHAEVTLTGTVASGSFNIYRTNQTGLFNEVKRAGGSGYVTGSANCGTTYTGNLVKLKRTIDMTAEAGPVTYTEVGMSDNSSAGANLNTRILLTTPVSLLAGQSIRVIYTLSIALSPITAQVVAAPGVINNINQSATTVITYPLVTIVDSNGGNVIYASAPFEPSAASTTMISPSTAAFPAYNTDFFNRTDNTAGRSKNNTLNSYVAGRFTREKTVTFSAGEAVMTMGTICLTTTPLQEGMMYKFDVGVAKDNLHTLTLTWLLTWSRTLA